MSWLAVLPVVATLFAEAPASITANPFALYRVGSDHLVTESWAPPPQAPSDADGAETHWYGGPAVAADVAEVALLYEVTKYTSDYNRTHYGSPGYDGNPWDAPGAQTAASLLVFSTLVSGAVVHGLHQQGSRAMGSIALRTGALLAGVLLFEADSGHCVNRDDCVPSFGIGALIALPLVAMAVDDAFLAREAVPAAAPAKAAWTPTLRIQSGLAMLGMGASF
jgi:hypothetical protein